PLRRVGSRQRSRRRQAAVVLRLIQRDHFQQLELLARLQFLDERLRLAIVVLDGVLEQDPLAFEIARLPVVVADRELERRQLLLAGLRESLAPRQGVAEALETDDAKLMPGDDVVDGQPGDAV